MGDRVPALTPELAETRLEQIRAVRDDVFALLLAAAGGGTPPADAVRRINARARERPVVAQLPDGRRPSENIVLGDPDPVARACEHRVRTSR